MSKGDITIQPNPARDLKLDRIAAHLGTTKNALIAQVAAELSRVPPEYFYEALGAVSAACRNCREHHKKTTI